MIANFEKPETFDRQTKIFVVSLPMQVYNYKYTLEFGSISPACGQ